jgi:hypothetical protein
VTDRRALVDELVLTRSMVIATLPADDEEPDALSTKWSVGIGRVLISAGRERDLRSKRDSVMLVGAHILGWLVCTAAMPDCFSRFCAVIRNRCVATSPQNGQTPSPAAPLRSVKVRGVSCSGAARPAPSSFALIARLPH